MAPKNKLGIESSPELAQVEERISKKKAAAHIFGLSVFLKSIKSALSVIRVVLICIVHIISKEAPL